MLSGMANARDWMTLTLSQMPTLARRGSDATFRALTPADAPMLALLMYESYRGTVDDAGETHDDARGEVAKLLAGDFGAVDWGASLVCASKAGLASATIITRDGVAPPPLALGEAFLAFSMTAPHAKRQGLARAGLLQAVATLRARGEHRLHLVVTRANTPALRLYESLGFVVGPIGE